MDLRYVSVGGTDWSGLGLNELRWRETDRERQRDSVRINFYFCRVCESESLRRAECRIRREKGYNICGNSRERALGHSKWCWVWGIGDFPHRFVIAGLKTGCVSVRR